MMGVSVKVEGLEALGKKLMALDLNKQQKAVKAAGRAAFKPVLEDAQQNVPVRSGLLKDSLRITSRTSTDSSFPIEIGLTMRNEISLEDPEGAARIIASFGKRGVRIKGRRVKGKGRKVRIETGAAWRWHFVEIGVPARGIPARPFLRPALARNKEAVTQRFRDRLAQLVERLARTK